MTRLALLLLGLAGPARGGELDLDLHGRLNPEGVAAFATWGPERLPEGEHRVLRASVRAGITPAFGQAGLVGEWVPHPALQLRAGYDALQYLGASDGLLSFAAHDAGFGDRERDALSGSEEAVAAHRVMLQPALRLRAGRWLLFNQADLARYWMGGRGPFLLELEYDTLLEKRDWLVANRTAALATVWRGAGGGELAAGPVFELTRSVGAGLERRRLGAALRWTLADPASRRQRAVVSLTLGLNLADPNRRGRFFLLGTVGTRLKTGNG